MLFVADRLPSELRKVVEFMNVQMRPAEVLAVELRRGGLRTLAPIVLGQTQEAIEQKSGAGAKSRRLWDEPRVLEALSAAGDPASALALEVLLEGPLHRERVGIDSGHLCCLLSRLDKADGPSRSRATRNRRRR